MKSVRGGTKLSKRKNKAKITSKLIPNHKTNALEEQKVNAFRGHDHVRNIKFSILEYQLGSNLIDNGI